MIFELKNGNYLKVNKQIELGYNRTYIDFTVTQKDGCWKHNEQTTYKNSIFSSTYDFLSNDYNLKQPTN